jgi:spore germination protein GerM
VRATLVSAAAAALLLAACGIDPDSGPRAIPTEQRVAVDQADQAAGQSSGASRVFLVAEEENGRVLRSVLRDVPPGALDVMQALVAGPNEEEIEEGLQTAVPVGSEVLSARIVGPTLVVDLSPQILELQSTALRLAVAQIVFTAGELEGVRSVTLRVDGQRQAWPAGQGDLQDKALTVYDFPGYAESAQPAYPPVPSGSTP